uniref:Nudix hydrolase 20ic-like isoform X3 n=1 Tax=Rhizophora mucronata TaxID=61149 RepID=A0A2P2JK10_RHIMU
MPNTIAFFTQWTQQTDLSERDRGIPASSSHSFIRFFPQEIPEGCHRHHEKYRKEAGFKNKVRSVQPAYLTKVY